METAAASLIVAFTGCNSFYNGWLDPTILGAFDRTATLEIRSSLTLEDTSFGIPGANYPMAEDLEVVSYDFPITAGDTLAIEIYELRERQVPFQTQAVVSAGGYVNLPVVGRVTAAGLTIPEFEQRLRETLKSRQVLLEPEATVNPLFLQNATYSIFGIGVSASNNAPLRAGTFPIRRTDLNVLEAINQVGGLSEFVTDIYVFRRDKPSWLVDQHRRKQSKPPVKPEENNEKGKPKGEMSEDNHRPKAIAPSERPVPDGESGAKRHSEVDDLIAVVEDKTAKRPRTPPEPVIQSLQPEPSDPYIWLNGEFVPNPSYRKTKRSEAGESPGSSKPGLSPFDRATPAVNWARIAGDTSFRVIRIPAELLRSGDPELNIIIRPGDVIRIVSGEIGVYYIMGQVNRVGAFAFNAEPITLKAAIAAAGGLSSLAWPDRCTVYRRIGQREQMIQVDLDRVFAGKDSDFFIRRGDIINVGTHPFAPFLQSIRGFTIPNPVSNVGYSFTYARNFADIDSFAVQRNPANEPKRFPQLFP